MLILLINGLTIAGAGLLLFALLPVRRMIAELPAGRIRRNWYILAVLIIFFIDGYIGHAAAHWNRRNELSDLIVPAVFLLAACFVLLVNTLSVQTAFDLRRMAILEHESITDPVMGIYNRRYLERRLKEELARAQRYDLPFSILLIDIDQYKELNDIYGHQAGDFILSSLGKLIVNTARKSDIVARYGGVEILVMAPNTNGMYAARLAERLRQTVVDSNVMPPGMRTSGQAVTITISIGVAVLGPETSDTDTLLRSADEALYRAKSEGRNRVVVSETGRGT